MDSLLTRLTDELPSQDITGSSAVLGALSDDDLQTAYDHVLEHFALALLIGAHRDSSWSNGNLVIAGRAMVDELKHRGKCSGEFLKR